MFRVKICGVRLATEIEAVGAFPESAIGLNFYRQSVRYVDPLLDLTRQLSTTAADLGLLRVGVFVNESFEHIMSVVDRVGIDAVQLHGDESLSDAADLINADQSVIRAIKLARGKLSVDAITAKCQPWTDAGCHLLLDADAGAAHGGSGKTLDWQSISNWSAANPDVHWTLAGGLTPSNVVDAIKTSRASSVDTASGVEEPRGVKSIELIREFCRQAAVR